MNNYIKILKEKLTRLLSVPGKTEDEMRRGKILNIILLTSLVAFLIINIIRIIDSFFYPETSGLPLWTTLVIFAFFAFLFYLSKKGIRKIAATLLIITYALPMIYCFVFWGTDLPAALLLAVLIITLSGILLSGHLALINTAILSAFLIIITDLQYRDIIPIESAWRTNKTQVGDAIANAALFIIIAVVAWLFCRGIARALARAEESEQELKKERDSLEIKVIERTAELRQAESEKINQLYRLAEFGRLSSGIFHDLINPLTAVSLNLEQINNGGEEKITGAKSYLSQALAATKRMELLIAGIKRQVRQEGQNEKFEINRQIEEIISLLSYRARKADVNLTFNPSDNISLTGEPVKFGQIITNLLANAIDACEGREQREIIISTNEINGNLVIKVKDYGSGINPENINKIFEPFFSTKKDEGSGLGLGLASTKNITEKDFNGSLSVISQLNQGAEFTVCIPVK